MNPTIFHLAFPITNVAQAKAYYADGLGCKVGRETRDAVILNLSVINSLLTSPKNLLPRNEVFILDTLG
jgi:extradiol dioxygenase family protein